MENNSDSTHSLLSPKRWPREAFPLGYSLLGLLGLGAILVLSLFVLLLGARAFGLNLQHADLAHVTPAETVALFVLQDVAYVPVLLALFWGLPRLAKRSIEDFGLGTPTLRDLQRGLFTGLITLVTVYVVSSLTDLITHQHHHQNELALFANLDPLQTIIACITAMVLAPFFEECIFRVLLFNLLLRYLPMGLAVFISAALFGLAHGQLDVAPVLAACGIIFAVAYYRTGSFWTNYIAHACLNGVTVIAITVFHAQG